MKIQIEEVKQLVIESEIEEALNLLLENTKHTNFENSALLLLSKYNHLEKDISNGIMSSDTSERGYNKIVLNILNLLDEIETDFFHNHIIYQDLVFFKSDGIKMPEKEDREYLTEFKTDEVLHIAWELGMSYQKIISPLNYKLSWHVKKPNNELTPKITRDYSLQTDWFSSWIADSWGAKTPGSWVKGTNTFELYIGKKKISKGSFKVI